MKFPNGLAKAMAAVPIGPTALARLLGETRQNVTRWRKGQRRLTPPMADKIAPHLGTSARVLLQVDQPTVLERAPRGGSVKVQRVPLISWVSAGKLAGSDLPANVRAEKRLPVADLGPGQWIALRVQGDSMNLIAPETSVIFVDLADKRLIEDRFYVFALETGDSTFKRYRGGRSPRLQPFSTNPDHETIPASDGLQVVGRVRRTTLEL